MNKDYNSDPMYLLESLYPNIFFDKSSDAPTCRGYECGLGWFIIISDACKKLSDYATENNVGLHVFEIKEKWGELRFYISTPSSLLFENYADQIIAELEHTARLTCHVCGKPGKMQKVTVPGYGHSHSAVYCDDSHFDQELSND